jgi:hypothetical protein
MPTLTWLYLTALLYFPLSGRCVAIAAALETVSHDRLTRMLQENWSGQTLLEQAFRTLFVFTGGYLILEDTVMPKPYATAIEGLAWGFSPTERKPAWGLSVVLLIWTEGTIRIPLGFRLWRKGGPAKYELAVELRSDARNRWHCRPDYVLFASWYPSKKLLKRIRTYDWYFVCRIQKNRCFTGRAVRHHRRHPYWAESGWRHGGSKGLVVRDGAKSYATNRLTLTAAEVRRLYRFRSPMEEGIKVWKSQLGVAGCQVRSQEAQAHHLACCLVAFCVLERERHDRSLRIYKLKQRLSSRGRSFSLSALERLREAA